MLYKNTSVKRVIAKVLTDSDVPEGELRISDMISWAGEALEKIGAFPSFETKVTGWDDTPHLKIVDYQAKLPCDFHTLVQAAYAKSPCGPYYPMRYGTGSFDYGKISNSVNSSVTTFPESSLVSLAMVLYDLNYADALTKLNNEPITRSNLNGLLNKLLNGLLNRIIKLFIK